jgi:hypothetical protein
MSATHPDCMADLERMYDDGPIPPQEKARVRKLELEKERRERAGLAKLDDII